MITKTNPRASCYLLFWFLSLGIFLLVFIYIPLLYLNNSYRDKQSKTRLDYITLDNNHHFLFVVVSAWVTAFDMHLQHNALQMHKALHAASLPRQMRDEGHLELIPGGNSCCQHCSLKIKNVSDACCIIRIQK